LNDTFTLRFHTELGYGNGYGNVNELPFYMNFYAGGYSSVRGFQSSSLGPRGTPADIYRAGTGFNAVGDAVAGYVVQTDAQGNNPKIVIDPNIQRPDPLGGNILITGSTELLFPLPFVKDQRSLRTSLFIDTGNVYSTNCAAGQLNCYNVDLSKLSVAAGFGLTWITGFGPLTFSIAKPIKENSDDRTEFFQFSLGTGF
jgi:outer membrane protein insertion porin family